MNLRFHIIKEVGTIYLIYNLDEPKVKAYEKLIDYALGKSDALRGMQMEPN